MSDGQTFKGVKEGTIVSFRNIPYAQPPTGNRRWKSPELITSYANQVDGTEDGFRQKVKHFNDYD